MEQENTERIERIRYDYSAHEPTKYDELKKLDKKVKRPAEIFAYTFGIVGSLVLGTGMCLAMEVLASGTVALACGIAVGIVGIGMVAINYFLYKRILKKRKAKYGERILSLSDELLHKQEN